MPIRITGIIPLTDLPPEASDADAIAAHRRIESFNWVNDQNASGGRATRDQLCDWLIGQKGKAYVINKNGETVYVFGAITPAGEKYVRAAKNGSWSNDIFEIATIPSATPKT